MIRFRHPCIPLAILFTAAFVHPVGAALVAKGLRCEYLVNPTGIDETQPRLSWVVESLDRGERQTAWQVLVASSAANLDAGLGDLWDSGKVPGDLNNPLPEHHSISQRFKIKRTSSPGFSSS